MSYDYYLVGDIIYHVKDGTTDITQLSDTIRVIGKRVPVIAGAEEISFYGILAGSPAATSGMANFAPGLVTEMYNSIHAHQIQKASSIFFDKILRFRHLDVSAVLSGFPIQNVYIKEAMNMLGMAAGSVHPPLTPLSQGKKEELRRVLRELRMLPSED